MNDRLRALIRQVRQKSGISQRELAARLGVRQSMVTRVEQGERSVTLAEYVAICGLLGLNPVETLESLLRSDPVEEEPGGSAADAS